MKSINHLFFLFVSLFATQIAVAQNGDNACKLILENGLYQTYNFTKSSNFSQDFRSYLISDVFRKDIREKKWSGTLSAVINNRPIKLGANSSEDQTRTFQESVRTATTFSLDESFYEYAKIAIPNVELAKIYSDCLEPSRLGFEVTPSISEKDVFFVITYKKMNDSDSMPKVTLFQIRNGSDVTDRATKSFVVNGFLQGSNTISVARDPNQDLSLILETDKRPVTYRVRAEPSGFNKDFPVGTIITSYLNWTEFQNVTQNNLNNLDDPTGKAWSAKYSKWSPADGREVTNSEFVKATHQTTLPDLRGMFLRGLNSFDPEENSRVASDRKDPDDRTRGNL